MNNQPKYRRPLNPNQLKTLQLIFKFRYITAPLLTQAINKKARRTTQQTLQILEEQKYLGKRYNANHRLQGKQAAYYLLPKAVHELRDRYNFNKTILNSMLRNYSLSDSFIEHHLDILRAYIGLQRQYPNTFHIFTKYELGDFDYFLKPLPDLYLHQQGVDSGKSKEFLLDLYADTPLFVVKRRVDAHIKHSESEDWQTTTSSDYPTVLIGCPNARIEANIQTYATRKLDQSELDITILTSSTKAMFGTSTRIWSNTTLPEELLTLGL